MKIVSYFLIFLLPSVVYAQTFTSISSSESPNDSSFYDIKKIDNENYWVAGEKGILLQISSDFKKTHIAYPNQGVNILKIDKFSNSHYVLCADEGIIYHYFKHENKWEVRKLPELKGKVIYNFIAINEKTAYICGGNSKIASSKKAIPNGFIYKTIDAGLTWQKIYKSIGSMIWDLDTSSNNNLIALKYNIRGSRLITFEHESNKIIKKSKLYSMLAHEYNANLNILVGANDFNIYKSGTIYNCTSNTSLDFKALIWDITSFHDLKIGSSCSGKIITTNNSNITSEIQAPTKFNLYGIVSVNDNSLLLIGSNKTIIKLELNNTDIKKLNN